jgi:hypothetical protein
VETRTHLEAQPWKIETAIGFPPEAKARRFKRYLKTGSGREFARRHLAQLSGDVTPKVAAATEGGPSLSRNINTATTLKELTRRIAIDELLRRLPFLCDDNHALPKER